MRQDEKILLEIHAKWKEQIKFPYEGIREIYKDEAGKDMLHPRYNARLTDKTKKQLSESMKGNMNKAGTKVKDTSKMSEAARKCNKGSDNPMWKGGISADKKKYHREYYRKNK